MNSLTQANLQWYEFCEEKAIWLQFGIVKSLIIILLSTFIQPNVYLIDFPNFVALVGWNNSNKYFLRHNSSSLYLWGTMPNQITMRMVVHFNVKLVWTLYFCVSFCNNLHTYTPSSNLLPHALVCRFGWALFNGWSLIQLNTSSTSFSKAKWDVTLFTWVQSPPFYLVHVHLQGSLCMVAKNSNIFFGCF